jgi:small subunit ribosomal protein S16
MVRIRLKRLGRKKRPFYRVVVTNARTRRDGAPFDELGYYDPIQKILKLDKARALEWIAKGATPSETAMKLIEKASETGELVQLASRPRPEKKAAAAPAAAVESDEQQAS